MSRKTKPKSKNYGILENGQVVRIDTILTGQDRYRAARHFKLAEVQYGPLDLDHTRKHRDELKAESEDRTKHIKSILDATKVH